MISHGKCGANKCTSWTSSGVCAMSQFGMRTFQKFRGRHVRTGFEDPRVPLGLSEVSEVVRCRSAYDSLHRLQPRDYARRHTMSRTKDSLTPRRLCSRPLWRPTTRFFCSLSLSRTSGTCCSKRMQVSGCERNVLQGDTLPRTKMTLHTTTLPWLRFPKGLLARCILSLGSLGYHWTDASAASQFEEFSLTRRCSDK